MNGTGGGDWAGPVSAVLGATSLSTAQIAASELIDQVLPGGAAVDPSALSLVELVGEPDVGLAASRYRAYMLAVLLAIATWIGTWRRAATANPALAGSAQEEGMIERALAEFCSVEVELLDDPDDEARSLMSVLVGSVGDTAAASEALIARYRREESPVVGGFIVQGLLRVLGRLPSGEASDLGRDLNRILADAPQEVRARASYEVRGGWRTAEEREALLTHLHVPESSAEPVHWPAEGV